MGTYGGPRMNNLVTGMIVGEFTTSEFLLSDIARKQWQADLVGGDVAKRQLEETERLLAIIKINRNDQRYIHAYNDAQQSIA